MDIRCEFTEMVDVGALVPNPKNANTHGERQISILAKNIEHQGFRHPIIVSKLSGFIAAGHGRLMAAQSLGMGKVPVDYQDFKNEADEFRFMIADNKISSLATHDDNLMIEGIRGLDLIDSDFELLGLDDFLLPLDPDAAKDEIEDDIPTDVETRCKLGDVWTLGEHRLVCGDSTDILQVERLMDGQKADITFTSPPYNIGKSIRGKMYENNADDMDDDDYLKFLIDWTTLAIEFSSFVFHNNQMLEGNKKQLIKYQNHFIDQIKDILIWNKKQPPPHINKGTFGCKWEYLFCLSKNGKSRSFPCKWQGKFNNVIETENNSGNEFVSIHKAGFPVSFPAWVIEKMDFAKYVYDPFGGTGSTLIACEKTNRKCYMAELDPKYCDVILTRWEKYSGKTATRET